MKAIYLSFLHLLRFIYRDMMLLVVLFAPLLCMLCYRFLIPALELFLCDMLLQPAVIVPYYPLLNIFFCMLAPAMFCFAAAMILLEERDEHTAGYLMITPLQRRGYLASRLLLPAIIACIYTCVLLPYAALSKLSYLEILLYAITGALQGLISAMLTISCSSNKLEGMAITKLSSLFILASAAPWFLHDAIQYLLSLFPSFWLGKAVAESNLFFLFPSFFTALLWMLALWKKFQRTISGLL
ncbi:hypothetical protein MKC66_11305 [[Clostridium] innocuum]|nr:hypothetical protein [[Clostridium] innocuum]